MTSQTFNPKQGPLLIKAEATGPNGAAYSNLVLDTGATVSVIKPADLVVLGFGPAQPARHVHLTTGGFVGVVPDFVLTRPGVLGQTQFLVPVVGRTLAAGQGIDGMLGLDFLRDRVLTIGFRLGQITLACSGRIGGFRRRGRDRRRRNTAGAIGRPDDALVWEGPRRGRRGGFRGRT
jgi:hypothetical protein